MGLANGKIQEKKFDKTRPTSLVESERRKQKRLLEEDGARQTGEVWKKTLGLLHEGKRCAQLQEEKNLGGGKRWSG